MGDSTTLHTLGFEELLREACALRDAGKGRTISYSPKVFIPLTRLCSNRCIYCGYRSEPASPDDSIYLDPEEVLAIARAGERAGVTEALVVTGDRPETRYPAAEARLRELGCSSTPEYAARVCRLILEETRLLPHTNCGLLDPAEMEALAEVNASLGLMLESTSQNLSGRGGAHERSPAKAPARRLAVLEQAGSLRIPFTTGILIGIGETSEDRIASLEILRHLNSKYGHIQEVIIQNLRPQEGTSMARVPAPTVRELLWTIAAARVVLGPAMNIQAPPNLALDLGASLGQLIAAGINDWGGVSPVTIDVVNRGAKWPSVAELRRQTEAAGFRLRGRFPVYPETVLGRRLRLSAPVRQRVDQQADRDGFVRMGIVQSRDRTDALRTSPGPARPKPSPAAAALSRAAAAEDLEPEEIVSLFSAQDRDARELYALADELRRRHAGGLGTYVVNRNINFTNVCFKKCRFCGFSRRADHVDSFHMSEEEVLKQVRQAERLGATEVCIQAGLSPKLPPDFYLALFARIKTEVPAMHIHGVSPEEVDHSARLLGIGVEDYLVQLRDAGLGSMPGTSAEILDDAIRQAISPRRIPAARWVEIIQAAHRLGIRTTATMMYGHVETFAHRARHLALLRDLQCKTRGFTEFVPLRFIGWLRGDGSPAGGRTFVDEDVQKTHAIARLVLGPSIRNIQVSWVKEGIDLAARCLRSGANDLGGTLMNERISASAGGTNGEILKPGELQAIIRRAGLVPAERSTLYEIRTVFGEDAGRPPHPLDLVDESELRRVGASRAR